MTGNGTAGRGLAVGGRGWAMRGIAVVSALALGVPAAANDFFRDRQELEGAGGIPITDLPEVVAILPPSFPVSLPNSIPSGFNSLTPNFLNNESGGHEAPESPSSPRPAADCETTDNPVVIATGNKLLDEVDFASDAFNLTRTYSKAGLSSGFGDGWNWTFGLRVTGVPNPHYDPTCIPDGDGFCVRPTGEYLELTVHRPNGVAQRYVYSAATQRYEDSRPQSTSYVVEDVYPGPAHGSFRLAREDGAVETYDNSLRIAHVREPSGRGWTYTYTGGLLSSVAHSSGRSIGVQWSGGRISRIVAPNGKAFDYGYSNGRLTGVTYPDGLGSRTYHYENAAHPGALTGYSISGVRRTRYAYHADGKVAWSGLEGGAERDTFTYGSTYTDVSNALGFTVRHHFGTVAGVRRLTQVSRPASTACPSGNEYRHYDARGYLQATVDFEGNRTNYSYNDRGRLLSRVSGIAPGGVYTHALRTEFAWDAASDLLLRERHFGSQSGTVPVREIEYAYHAHSDARRRRLPSEVSVCVPSCSAGGAVKRITGYTYTFHANNEMASMVVDGPLADTGDRTTTEYDTLGRAVRATDGLGHVTQWLDHDGLGLPGRTIDVDGLTTRYTWDAKGRLLTTTVEEPTGNSTWTNAWRSDDQLASATDPTGLVTTFVYDGIGRRTEVQRPAVGPGAAAVDRQVASYNLLSRVTRLDTGRSATATGALTLASRAHYEYDTAGHLARSYGNDGQETLYDYDRNGRLAGWSDAAGGGGAHVYDAHGRPAVQVDAQSNQTTFGYDVLGRLASVTDPRGNTTGYVYNGFDDLLQQVSPDTGTTSHAYAATGLRTSTTRSDLSQLTFTHDGAGRLTKETALDGERRYEYDNCLAESPATGRGRLCRAETYTAQGQLVTRSAFQYTRRGQLAVRHDTGSGADDITRYGYDGAGRTTSVEYPTGLKATYVYSHGRVSTVRATVPGGQVLDVATGIGYTPWGAVSGWTYGNGIVRTQGHDLDRRLYAIGGVHGATVYQSLTYGFDDRDLISAITDGVEASQSRQYEYDAPGRLTRQAYSGNSVVLADGFDAVGNRTSRTRHESGSLTMSLTYPIQSGSNRMTAISGTVNRSLVHNARGHLQSSSGWQGSRSYTYDGFDRLSSVTVDGQTTSYLVNATGQRKRKAGPLGTSRYVYAGQNALLAEHGSAGWKSYVYLHGQPVAVVMPNGRLHFIHADHLGRPEAVTRDDRATIWKAANGSYDRTVTYDVIAGISLGFPGQVWDGETGTWYNGFRDYDPNTGRYIQSDPIGLEGGLNTYVYALGNPVTNADPLGLGPVAFGLCTLANIGYQAYSYHQSLKVDGMDEMVQRLNKVSKEIRDCPLDDNEQYERLSAERDRIGQEILDATKAHAQSNAAYTLSDIAGGLAWQVGCTALLLAPIP